MGVTDVDVAGASAARMEPDRIDWIRNIPFILLQLGCVAVFWTGVSNVALAVGLVTLTARMFGLTAGYHRYFCHRGFKTSRVFQFVLAWLGASAAQRGPLWWAGHHRWHHRHADTAEDVHPPGVKGILWAHAGWIMSKRNDRTRIEWIRDFAAYRELRWLDTHHYVAPVVLGIALFALGTWLAAAYPELGTNGTQMVAVAFFCSTTLLYHLTFAVNSVGHMVGSRRYGTRDESRNSFLLALLTFGEGWHNNHHRYPASERQGFYWWEIDMAHYGVVILSWFRLVWDLRGPSADVLREGAR